MVCRERKGNAKSFQCSYHGWVFDSHGALTDVARDDAYAPGFNDDGSLNLMEVPRLDEYCGFVFINYQAEPEPPVDYLAGAREILELVSLQGGDCMEIVGGQQEYSVAANWKLLQENNADGYHTAVTHATYFDYIKSRDGKHAGPPSKPAPRRQPWRWHVRHGRAAPDPCLAPVSGIAGNHHPGTTRSGAADFL